MSIIVTFYRLLTLDWPSFPKRQRIPRHVLAIHAISSQSLIIFAEYKRRKQVYLVSIVAPTLSDVQRGDGFTLSNQKWSFKVVDVFAIAGMLSYRQLVFISIKSYYTHPNTHS